MNSPLSNYLSIFFCLLPYFQPFLSFSLPPSLSLPPSVFFSSPLFLPPPLYISLHPSFSPTHCLTDRLSLRPLVLSFPPPVSRSFLLPVRLSLSLRPSFCLSLRLFHLPSVHLSLVFSICLAHTFSPSFRVSLSPSLSLSLPPSVFLSFTPSHSDGLSLSLSLHNFVLYFRPSLSTSAKSVFHSFPSSVSLLLAPYLSPSLSQCFSVSFSPSLSSYLRFSHVVSTTNSISLPSAYLFLSPFISLYLFTFSLPPCQILPLLPPSFPSSVYLFVPSFSSLSLLFLSLHVFIFLSPR